MLKIILHCNFPNFRHVSNTSVPLIQVHGPPGQGPVFLAGTCGAPGGGDRDDEAEDAGTWSTTVYSTLYTIVYSELYTIVYITMYTTVYITMYTTVYSTL